MRIVGGEWGGRHLPGAVAACTRPTSDEMREALFNILLSRFAQTGERVLDLFAGTGALGLEALSRGAKSAVFVESDPKATLGLRKNLETLAKDRDWVLFNESKVFHWPRWLKKQVEIWGPFDLVLSDPPYGKNLGPSSFTALSKHVDLFTPQALWIMELSKRDKVPEQEGWDLVHTRERGDTKLLFYQRVQ